MATTRLPRPFARGANDVRIKFVDKRHVIRLRPPKNERGHQRQGPTNEAFPPNL